MNKTEHLLKKNAPTILTIMGGAGVIATAVLAVKATPRATALLEEAKQEKGEALTLEETIITGWKPYIPSIITGASTIACIFGSNFLNKKTQACLMSAYAILDSSYKEYRDHVRKNNPEFSDVDVIHDIVKSKFSKGVNVSEDKQLFFDYQSMRYFESTFEEVKEAERIFNENFSKNGYACLNDYYDLLGIDHVNYGWQLGWSTVVNDDAYAELDFSYERGQMDDGLEYWIIEMPNPPFFDYKF